MDLDGAIYNKDKQLLTYDEYDYDDIEDVRFCMYLNANENYYLEVSPANGVTGNYKISVTSGRTLNVPKYNQLPYTNLCWANSAAMIISYYKNDTQNRALDIAKNSKNSNLPYVFNDGSSPQPIVDAVRNYVGPSYSLNQLTSVSDADKFTFEMVKACIDKSNPLVYYLKWKLVWGSHFHVIVGYKSQNGTDYIIYNDPLDGKQHMMTFDLYRNNAEWGYYCSYALQN
ncbi:MAG TPA: papain-like cysteine protease family protein [Pseudobacteroides sp.]|uniref:C39 family peptidase n=1 Tax=Pseudobacteroides sp. TaxID=1968840 RepID=UPI002F91C3F4